MIYTLSNLSRFASKPTQVNRSGNEKQRAESIRSAVEVCNRRSPAIRKRMIAVAAAA
ncbi:hypothetical protein [Rosistilla oblonga]|uniref:hypothetical protein n=1 Tax=Rosistilla oblonga TaxID=2527990 RepID=UPI003A96E93D